MDVHAARTAVYWLHSSPPAAGRRTLRKKLVFPYRASHLAAGASLFCSPNAFRATFTNGLCIARPHSASITRGILVMSLLPPPFSSPSVAERSDRHNPFTGTFLRKQLLLSAWYSVFYASERSFLVSCTWWPRASRRAKIGRAHV